MNARGLLVVAGGALGLLSLAAGLQGDEDEGAESERPDPATRDDLEREHTELRTELRARIDEVGDELAEKFEAVLQERIQPTEENVADLREAFDHIGQADGAEEAEPADPGEGEEEPEGGSESGGPGETED